MNNTKIVLAHIIFIFWRSKIIQRSISLVIFFFFLLRLNKFPNSLTVKKSCRLLYGKQKLEYSILSAVTVPFTLQ